MLHSMSFFGVASATTTESTQTTSGLEILPNSADTVNSFQITNITGGSLFLNDGVTPVTDGEFITIGQGKAGLTFTPANGSLGGFFNVQESSTTDASGLEGETIAGEISVTLPSTTSFTWNGDGGNTSWNDGANWVGGQVPTTGAIVLINTAASVVYDAAAGSSTITSLTLDNGASLSITGGALTMDGDLAFDDSAAASGLMTLTGGTLLDTAGAGGTVSGAAITVPAGGVMIIGANDFSSTSFSNTSFSMPSPAVVEIGNTTSTVTFTGSTTYGLSAGSSVELDNGTFSGTLTGTGAGTVQLDPTRLLLGAGGLTLNCPGNMFQWVGGALDANFGDLTNLGTINLSSEYDKEFFDDPTLDNFGTITESGTGGLGLYTDTINPAVLMNETGAIYQFEGSGGIAEIEEIIGSQGPAVPEIINDGTISQTYNGTLQLVSNPFGPSGPSSPTDFVLSNSGTIEADAGTLDLDVATVNQVSGGTLTGGTWNAINGATLQLPSAVNITTNTANISLAGAGATISGISNLAANSGSLSLSDGATFTTVGDFVNSGTLTLGTSAAAGGTLAVSGNFTQTSQGTIDEQIGGASASLLFGTLSVTGTAALAGAFNVTMVNGYAATSGDSYQVMTFSSFTGGFASFSQAGSAFTQVLNPSNLTLDVAVSQSDLEVDSVTAPMSALEGQQITVDWQVTNDSSNPAGGSWLDSVYMSPTPTITGSSTLLGTVTQSGGLGADDSYDASLTAALPALLPSSYYVLVQTDSLYQVPDANRANGTLAATGLLTVSATPLTLGVAPPDTTFSAPGQSQYYQVNVPAGGSLGVALTSSAASGATALYVSRGVLPTAANYQFAGNTANQPNQSVTVPQVLQPGVYYILAESVSGDAATADYTLTTTQTSTLNVARISPQAAGNGGNVTVEIDGTNFSPTATAVLQESGGPSFTATAVNFASSSQLFATFNLTNAPVSTNYTLTVTQDSVSSGAQFQVVPATQVEVGGVPQASSFAPLTVTVSGPEFIRSGNTGTIVITYTNNTNNDIVAPLLDIQSTNADAFFSLPDNPNLYAQNAVVLAVPTYGVAGIIAPGASGQISVTLLSTDTINDDTIPIEVGQLPTNALINWNSQEAALQPATIPSAAWGVDFQNLENMIGNTTNSYEAALAQAATYLSSVGESRAQVSDLNNLWSFLVSQVDADFPTTTLASGVDASLPTPGSVGLSLDRSFASNIAGRYESGMFGLGWTTSWQGSLSVTDSGDATIDIGGTISYFTIQPNGTFTGVDGEPGTLLQIGRDYVFIAPSGTQYAFSSNGLLSYEQDTNGNRITLLYNGQNQIVSLTYSNVNDPSEPSEALTMTYNSQGFVSQVADGTGDVWTYSYDSTGHLLSVTAPGPNAAGLTTTYTYGSGSSETLNALESITSPDGSEQEFSYDGSGRLSSSTSADGATTNFSYLGEAEVETTVVGAGSTISWYDASGQQIRVQSPLGGISTNYYDNNGNLVESTNAAGDVYQYSYDSKGNLTKTVNPLGQVQQMTYNALSEVTSVTDADKNTSKYSYSSAGNLLNISYPDGTHQSFSYDPLGDVSQSIDQSGTPINYQFNAQGLTAEETFADGTYETFTYDAHGNMLTALTYDASGNLTGTTTLTYNGAEELTSVSYPNNTSLVYTYNALGQRTQSVDQTGYTLTYTYDAIGRLTGLSDGSGMVVTYSYNILGELDEKQNGNGTYTTYTYDAAGNLASEINYANSGGTIVNSSYSYTYNLLSEMTSMTDANGEVTTYGYDATGQLTQVGLPGGGSINYVYNAAGDRTQVINSGNLTSYSSNSDNEITQVGSATYTYDPDGNLNTVTDATGTTTYGYDDQNHLVSITAPDGTVTTFQYSPLGFLIGESVNGTQTSYLVDPSNASNVVSSYDVGSNSQLTLIAHYNYGMGLASQTGPSGTGYYDFDANGNTTGITGASGSYVNQYSYLPFGETTTTSAALLPNPFTFSGQSGVLQISASLFNMRARDYTPDTGQFLTNDPHNLGGGDTNLRRYAGNSPTLINDPTGFGGYDPSAWGQSLPQLIEGGALSGLLYHAEYLAANSVTAVGTLATVAQGAAGLPASEFCAAAGLSTTGTVAAVGAVGLGVGYGIGSGINWALGQFQGGRQFQENLGNTLYNGYQQVFGGPALAEKQEAEQSFNRRNNNNAAPPDSSSPVGDNYLGFSFNGSNIQNPPPVINKDDQDPNALIGPGGFGASNFIQDAGNLPYTIDFANDGGTAAQVVTVTQQLSSYLNWSTLQLGSFGFGTINVTVPAGLAMYETTVSYQNSDGSSLNVLVSLNFSVATGLLTATFTSLDPLTGQAPTGVFDGFLPPDDASGIGEGYVQYTVQPKSSLATGTTIAAQASVVFDTNAALDTAQVSNTIDSGAPTSSVTSLPGTESSITFPVSWSGQDDAGGSGIAGYNIWVSDNGGPYSEWQTDTANTSANYTGQFGHTYAFFSQAIDNVGNVEAPHAVADASTTITVAAPVLNTPGVTGATTTENTQTTSGLVITPNVADTAFVTNFQITGITGGTLFLNNGTTAITNGTFITVAQGALGLKFTPTTGSTASGSFTVQESINATAGGLGGTTATATITVNAPTLHTPTVTNATTTENTQTTSGLVITPNSADTAYVTNFEITGITGGTLFLNDGTTAISNGTFITVAQGALGLKFTPTTGSTASGSFTVQESINATTGGLGGTTATATITVNAPTLHTPGVTGATTTENTQTTSGLVITPNVADTAFVTNFQITGITGGTLFLNNGTTAITNGTFITVAQGALGLKFTPTTGSTASGSFTVQESINATAGGLGGTTATATITISSTTGGTISGTVYFDATGNGLTSDDTPQSGVKVYLDLKNDGKLDTNDPTVTTGPNGSYSFTGLTTGTYTVREVVPTGDVRTVPALSDHYTVALAAGQSSSGNNFDNAQAYNISLVSNVVYVLNDPAAVTDLRGGTAEGEAVEVSFTVASRTPATPFSLVSYTAAGPTYVASQAAQQQVFNASSGVFGPGSYTLNVVIPHSYYQVDFVMGNVIDHLGPAGSNISYSAQNRLISADNGGTHARLANPSTISGFAYLDSNNNGKIDANERPVASVSVTLTGTDSSGHSVSQSVLTDADGLYMFDNLPVGTYAVSETTPVGYTSGLATIGSVPGTAQTGKFSGIHLGSGVADTNNNFGFQQPIGAPVAGNQTGSIAFWNSASGQALIKALNGGPNARNLSSYLASNFPNIYGASAAGHNLTGMTNAQVAAFYQQLYNESGPKLDAEIMALALSTYVTKASLAGNAAASYGFAVSTSGLATATFSVGTNGAAFGVDDNAVLTVLDLLTLANTDAHKGLLWDLDGNGSLSAAETMLRLQADELFDTINNT